RRRHTRLVSDWSSDVCSSDLTVVHLGLLESPTRETSYSHELEGVGTMQVLNACRRARTHKLIVRSFTWLYGARATNPAFLAEKRSEERRVGKEGREGWQRDH